MSITKEKVNGGNIQSPCTQQHILKNENIAGRWPHHKGVIFLKTHHHLSQPYTSYKKLSHIGKQNLYIISK